MSHLPKIDPEFKGLIPPLTPEERKQLEQNILADCKCHDPIILWEGVIIDGHNRFEICVQHGIEFQIIEMPLTSREAVKVWILNNQLSRRNLTDAARIEMALLKTELLQEKAKRNLTHGGRPKKGTEKPLSVSSKPKIEPIHIQKAIAGEAGIGEEKLFQYMQIKEHGSPQLLEKVKSGELKIGTAHRLLEKEIIKQLSQASKIVNFITHVIPETGCVTTNPEVHSKLVNTITALCQLLDKLEDDHEAA